MIEPIQMDPSVTNKGVPDSIGQKLVKPVITKKPTFKKMSVDEMFEDDYLSLLAVHIYKKFPLDEVFETAKFIQSGERVCIAKRKGVEYLSYGTKIFVEKT